MSGVISVSYDMYTPDRLITRPFPQKFSLNKGGVFFFGITGVSCGKKKKKIALRAKSLNKGGGY